MSDFTNINDPAGVTVLLENLRKSQAWQELDAQNDASRNEFQTYRPPHNVLASRIEETASLGVENSKELSDSSSNVLSLLARLQSTTSQSSDAVAPAHSHIIENAAKIHQGHVLTPSQSVLDISLHVNDSVHHPDKPPTPPVPSVRNMSFPQALPVIANLASDDIVHQKLKKIREQQDSLERQLWEERNQLVKNQEEKIKVSQRKAAIIGVDMSEKEVKNLQTSFMDELRKFDLERVLPTWDSLVASQQRALEELGVPGMFPTKNKTEREKQQRIIQVLEGLSGPDNNVANNQFEEP